MLSLLPSCATFWCWFQALRVASQCFSWRWSVDRSDAGDNNEFSAVGLQWCTLSRWSIHSKPDGDITWRFCWSCESCRESVRERIHIWACWNYKSYTSVAYSCFFRCMAWLKFPLPLNYDVWCIGTRVNDARTVEGRDALGFSNYITVGFGSDYSSSLQLHGLWCMQGWKQWRCRKKNRGFMGFLYVSFLSSFNPLHYPNKITWLKCISGARVLQDI